MAAVGSAAQAEPTTRSAPMRRVNPSPASHVRPPPEWERGFAAIARDGNAGGVPDHESVRLRPADRAPPPEPPRPEPAGPMPSEPPRSTAPPTARKTAKPADPPRSSKPIPRAARKRKPVSSSGEARSGRPSGTDHPKAEAGKAAPPEPKPEVRPAAGAGSAAGSGRRSEPDGDTPAFAGFEALAATGPSRPTASAPVGPAAAAFPRRGAAPGRMPDWSRHLLSQVPWPPSSASWFMAGAALLVATTGLSAAYITTAIDRDPEPGAADHAAANPPMALSLVRETVTAGRRISTPCRRRVPPLRWPNPPSRR